MLPWLKVTKCVHLICDKPSLLEGMLTAMLTAGIFVKLGRTAELIVLLFEKAHFGLMGVAHGKFHEEMIFLSNNVAERVVQ